MFSRGNALSVKVLPLLFAAFFLSLSISFAGDINHYIEKANSLRLADDPLWEKLLHFKSGRSQILDNDFFLSEFGSTDSYQELEATITAYFTRKHSIKRISGDNDVLCIFPARYTWLNEKLQFPDFSIDHISCPALSRWAKLDEIDTVGLVYVSGYLGNPASSFGHVLLNLKRKGFDGLEGLLDTSLSYGATVPINENIIFYVLKGLFGGYYSSFTDKYYYAHDQVYSNREARDMWEYRLILDDTSKKLLIYHIAELLTKRHRYFFLNANCAQRIAVLLNIFIPEDVYPLNYPVYVPEQLFHRLQYIDQRRRINGEVGLIADVSFIPSARRRLYFETQHLTADEAESYRAVSQSLGSDFSSLEELNTVSRIRILNALLSYRYYKLMSEEEDTPSNQLTELKDRILLQRLRLPPQQYVASLIKEIPSPIQTSPPSAFSFGVMMINGKKPFYTLGVSMYRKESIGLNALEFNELVALNLSFGLLEGSKKFFFDTFDFIRIRDFRTLHIKNEDEKPISWRLRVGVDRTSSQKYDGVLDGGIGLVNKPVRSGIVYGFLNLSIHTQKDHYRVGPSIGAVFGNDKIKTQTDIGYNYVMNHHNLKFYLKTKFQYQFGKEYALNLNYEKSSRERFGMNFLYYW